jgi:hypothetical protein
MLENHVHAAITRRRLRSGPAANPVDDFAAKRDYAERFARFLVIHAGEREVLRIIANAT